MDVGVCEVQRLLNITLNQTLDVMNLVITESETIRWGKETTFVGKDKVDRGKCN